ncbi:MAG: ATP-binding protein [Clostridia bacterium]|nr:ATP-binding protein [Clostridia bacterium]
MRIIGREKEYSKLQAIYNSGKPELVVVKGRRRIGKTYLVNNAFGNRFAFKHTGMSPVDLTENTGSKITQQLDSFCLSLRRYGYKGKKPTNWLDAFFLLEKLLESKNDGKRQVVFIDELPWLDTPRSSFVSSFEQFWNNWGSTNENLMLIVCGSSSSWINDNLLNNYGGLYNRITQIIDLKPFNLRETKEFYEYKDIVMSDYDIVQSYMIFGGIPFYLDQLDRSLSLAENVTELFFQKNSVLNNEYDHLFRSAFKSPEEIKKIVFALSKKRIGLTKKEITKCTSISDGGSLSSLLLSLIASNIIIRYVPFGRKKTEHHYKLVDPFCLFYLYFIEKSDSLDRTFWQDNVLSQSVISWRGFAFENVCFYHIEEIKDCLRIGGLSTRTSGFSYGADENGKGGQVDLLIIRNDNIVDMCELKFYSKTYTVTSHDVEMIKNREVKVLENLSKKFAIHHILITTFGASKNAYSSYFQKTITIQDLL